VMRHVLVDYARHRRRVKHGGAAVHIPVDAAAVLSPERVDEIVAVDLALQRLAQADERKSRVFEMRFFGGLSVEETAEVLGVAPNTVIRDWNFARAWLRRELGGAGRNARNKLRKSSRRRYNAILRNATPSSAKPAATTPRYSGRSSLCWPITMKAPTSSPGRRLRRRN